MTYVSGFVVSFIGVRLSRLKENGQSAFWKSLLTLGNFWCCVGEYQQTQGSAITTQRRRKGRRHVEL